MTDLRQSEVRWGHLTPLQARDAAEAERDRYREDAEVMHRNYHHMREERDKWRGLCEMVDAHYSGSLDYQPAYVKAIREALGA